MRTYYVDLSKFESVKRFVELSQNKSCPCALKSGKYVVDAKSILGIFSLDLSKPVILEVEDGDYAMFDTFIVNIEV